MRGAVEQLGLKPDLCLVDGNRDPGLGLPTRTVVKGDASCASVAAASILAKVTRDRLMVEYDKQYPGYGFAVHKGYGTRAHYAAIDTLGICPIHRRSFLKNHG
jgi:ribonuclease HII